MPVNAKQELEDTPATDLAAPNSEEKFGTNIICDRVDRKIQDKLPKQTKSFEENLEIPESGEETRDQTSEQTDLSGKTLETDSDDTKSAGDTPESSDSDLESDNGDEETEEGQSDDSEQDEENAQLSCDENPKESIRQRRFVQANDQQGEGWLLVAFSLGIIALILILEFVFGFRVRDIDFSEEDLTGTTLIYEQISYYLFPKLL